MPEAQAATTIDCAVICTDHTAFDYAAIAKRFPLVVDTRNALKGIQADNIFRCNADRPEGPLDNTGSRT